MRKFVIADPEKCVGCGICEFFCSMIKEKVFNPRKSRIRMVNVGPTINLAIACRLCEGFPCVRGCVREALGVSEVWGTIIVDENKCNGCGWCIEACKYGAITLHPDRATVIVCDLCGGDPECINFCPADALKFTTLESYGEEVRREVVTSLFKSEKIYKSSIAQRG